MANNKNYINGVVGRCPKRQRTWQVINPATEKPSLPAVPFGNADDAHAAIDAATQALKGWKSTNPYQRADILKQVAHLMRTRANELADITIAEAGKPILEARGEWVVAAQFFDWFAEEGKRVYGRTITTSRNNKRMTVDSTTDWRGGYCDGLEFPDLEYSTGLGGCFGCWLHFCGKTFGIYAVDSDGFDAIVGRSRCAHTVLQILFWVTRQRLAIL